MEALSFEAQVITGAGRGKDMGVPTLNVDLNDVPETLEEGIYACWATVLETGESYMGAMHYGPRPVFEDDESCEVHLIDQVLEYAPDMIEITVVHRLRDIQNFPSTEALMLQIQEDIKACKDVLIPPTDIL